MRYPSEGSIPGGFAGDIPGGTLIECPECIKETKSYEKFDEPLYCDHCKKELHYEKHWSW